MNEEKSIEGTRRKLLSFDAAAAEPKYMYDHHNTKNSMQFAYNNPYIMSE